MTKPVPMDGVGDVAASHHAVLRTNQAADLGLSVSQLRRLQHQGALASPVPGVYVVHGSVPTWRQRLAFASAAVGGGRAVISHRSAAALHGLDGFDEDVIEITVRRGELAHLQAFMPDLVRHQVSIPVPAQDLIEIDGLLCTTLARTLVDLPAVVPNRVIGRALDEFERRGLNLAWLEEVAVRQRRPGHRGAKLVVDEIARRRARGQVSGSWMETVLAECVRSSLLPDVVGQYEIRDGRGRFVARVDLAIPALRLAIEGHSRSFHAAVSDGLVDQRRENRAMLVGWLFAYLGWGDTTTPDRTRRFIERIAATRARDLGLGELPLSA